MRCRHHLYLDVSPRGIVKVNFPDLERVDQVAVRRRLAAAAREMRVTTTLGAAQASIKLGTRWIRADAPTRTAARRGLMARLRRRFEGEETYLALDEMEETCSLDVADQGGQKLVRVGRLINLTLERARQLRDVALHKIREAGMHEGWVDRSAMATDP